MGLEYKTSLRVHKFETLLVRQDIINLRYNGYYNKSSTMDRNEYRQVITITLIEHSLITADKVRNEYLQITVSCR